MKHLFAPYEIALKLKEKGFEERCFGHFIEPCLIHLLNEEALFLETTTLKTTDFKIINAPTYQQVLDWFRGKHNILIYALPMEDGGFCDVVFVLNNDNSQYKNSGFSTYYEALDKAIEEALKLI